METIQGRKSLDLDADGFKNRLANYHLIALDLGTGDGRYACSIATTHPDWFVIGLDACRENLYEHSRVNLPNMLFVIAGAEQLPPELHGLCSHLTINFPWGSLLEGLLACDPGLMLGLSAISRSQARIEIHLNGGALTEAGTDLGSGAERICINLKEYGWNLKTPCRMDQGSLANFPSTWAKRLAYGRDPRAMRLSGSFSG